jgi:hypothetical protein
VHVCERAAGTERGLRLSVAHGAATSRIRRVGRIVPLAVLAVPLALGECSGDSTSTADASGQGDGRGSDASRGQGNAGSGAPDGDGAGPDTGSGSTGQDAGTLCTALGTPPGCVQCVTNANCPTTTPHCLGGRCVTCVISSDCGTGTTPVCWPGNHTCHAACGEGGATCPAMMGQPNICDTNTGACVGCRSSMDCPTASPVCDSTTMRCAQCQADNNCTGTTPHCDPATSTCVACVTNADCTNPAAPICRSAFGATGAMGPMGRSCQAGCTSRAQCTDGGATVCDSNGNCVQCVDNSTCSGVNPVCDTMAIPFGRGATNASYHRCVVCLPPAPGSDASTQGCDGGPGTCYYNFMQGGYVCR